MRRIVITGASAGIGAALAQHYAAPESVIGLIARRAEPMQALAARLPGRFEIFALDVADGGALGRAAREFCERHGAPDLVIANAGISVGTHGDEAADVDKLRRVLEVNVVALAATLAAFAAGHARRRPRHALRHRQRRRVSRPARRGRLQRLEVGRDHVAGGPARRARGQRASPWSRSARATSTRR